MSTLHKEQRLFLTDGETFDWPVEHNGKPRQFRVEWVWVKDTEALRSIMLAGFLILLNGETSIDYGRGWINLYVEEIPEPARKWFE